MVFSLNFFPKCPQCQKPPGHLCWVEAMSHRGAVKTRISGNILLAGAGSPRRSRKGSLPWLPGGPSGGLAPPWMVSQAQGPKSDPLLLCACHPSGKSGAASATCSSQRGEGAPARSCCKRCGFDGKQNTARSLPSRHQTYSRGNGETNHKQLNI